jgi:proteasome lid subunit RPN8/RPN11
MVDESLRAIDSSLLAAIYRQAIAEYPKECCGYILQGAEGMRVIVCKNRQDQLHALDPVSYPRNASTAYNIGGRELLSLVHSFESNEPAVIIYHSHPRVGAYFSAEDVRAALAAGYPVDYLVVDVQDGYVVESKLFRRRANAEEFDEVARFAGSATV